MTNEELAMRIKNGETELSEQLWFRVLPKVKKYAYQYKDYGKQTNWVELDDLIQSGFLAMMDAVKHYDPAKGYEFEAYLKFPMIEHMRKCIGESQNRTFQSLKGSDRLDRVVSRMENADVSLGDTIESDAAAEDFEKLIDDVSARQDLVHLIVIAKEHLTRKQWELIVLRYYFGVPYSTLAKKYNQTEHGVESSATSAVRFLRDLPEMQALRSQYVDQHTDFYKRKGLTSFNASWTSVVEDLTEIRENLNQKYIPPMTKKQLDELRPKKHVRHYSPQTIDGVIQMALQACPYEDISKKYDMPINTICGVMRRRNLNHATKGEVLFDEIVSLKNQGHIVKDIALALRISESTVTINIRKAKAQGKIHSIQIELDPRVISAILRMHQRGVSVTKMGTHFGLDRHRLSDICREFDSQSSPAA